MGGVWRRKNSENRIGTFIGSFLLNVSSSEQHTKRTVGIKSQTLRAQLFVGFKMLALDRNCVIHWIGEFYWEQFCFPKFRQCPILEVDSKIN